jgi:serine/threonine-protein kinase
MNDRCSPALLKSALAGNLLAEDETSLNAHLETCEACSAALEQMAGGQAWCQEAASLLAEDELDGAMLIRDEWSEADFTVEHLEPSDEPDVLGRLGGYDVLEVIGQGGMGVVLKGFDRELKRCIAIKVLAPHLARSSLARKRFAREAQAAAAVVHPHVLPIHQVQPSGRLPFLVMPLVAGESLAERLAAQGTLELKEILRIGMQAASGLAAAHEQGLVHRDVKPENILLEKGVERAVLTDFGLARAADDVTLTRWGIVAGTPQYMSPEQARGEPLDGRSDLFSLGCVLYEMATGVSPFRSDTMLATMRRLVDDPPQAMASLNPELPPWFIGIVERLLEKDPLHRFQSAQEVSDLLEECLAHVQQPAAVPLPAALAKPAERGVDRGRGSRIMGVLAMIAAFGIGVFGIMLASATPPEIAGRWSGEEWGEVMLERTGDGAYAGTYRDTFGAEPGNIQLKWSRIERRFNGTWSEGTDRFGEISVRLQGDEIRGAHTTDSQSRINPGTPRLSDLSWRRVIAGNDDESETSPARTENAEERGGAGQTVFNRRERRTTDAMELLSAIDQATGVPERPREDRPEISTGREENVPGHVAGGDLARLQGMWEGQTRSGDDEVTVRLTIDGSTFTETRSSKSEGAVTTQGRIELDESTDPKQLTLKGWSMSSSANPVASSIPAEFNAISMWRAIYKLNDQGFTLRGNLMDRPTEFDENDTSQIVFKRIDSRRLTSMESKCPRLTWHLAELPSGEWLACSKCHTEANDQTRQHRSQPLDTKELLVGTWTGLAGQSGESYTFRADGTFTHESTLGRHTTSDGKWEFDDISFSLLLRTTKSDDQQSLPRTQIVKIAGLGADRLAFDHPSGPLSFARSQPQVLRCELRCEKNRWNLGDAPTLNCRIVNTGTMTHATKLEQGFHRVEVDGRPYTWAGDVSSEIKPIAAGSIVEMRFTLEEANWVPLWTAEYRRSQRLQLNAGKHKIWVCIFAGSGDEGSWNDPGAGPLMQVWSNAVEIEMVAADGDQSEVIDSKKPLRSGDDTDSAQMRRELLGRWECAPEGLEEGLSFTLELKDEGTAGRFVLERRETAPREFYDGEQHGEWELHGDQLLLNGRHDFENGKQVREDDWTTTLSVIRRGDERVLTNSVFGVFRRAKAFRSSEAVDDILSIERFAGRGHESQSYRFTVGPDGAWKYEPSRGEAKIGKLEGEVLRRWVADLANDGFFELETQSLESGHPYMFIALRNNAETKTISLSPEKTIPAGVEKKIGELVNRKGESRSDETSEDGKE